MKTANLERAIQYGSYGSEPGMLNRRKDESTMAIGSRNPATSLPIREGI